MLRVSDRGSSTTSAENCGIGSRRRPAFADLLTEFSCLTRGYRITWRVPVMPLEVSFAASASAMAFTAFALAAILTPIVRATARRFGAVAAPRADRWHAKPTATMGGIAIFIAVMAVTLALQQQTRDRWIVLAASSAMFFFGLADDHFELKPYQKLVAQVITALAISYFG